MIPSRADWVSERPHCTLKMIPPPLVWYHVTDDQCVRVDSLLVESIDTAMQDERE